MVLRNQDRLWYPPTRDGRPWEGKREALFGFSSFYGEDYAATAACSYVWVELREYLWMKVYVRGLRNSTDDRHSPMAMNSRTPVCMCVRVCVPGDVIQGNGWNSSGSFNTSKSRRITWNLFPGETLDSLMRSYGRDQTTLSFYFNDSSSSSSFCSYTFLSLSTFSHPIHPDF